MQIKEIEWTGLLVVIRYTDCETKISRFDSYLEAKKAYDSLRTALFN